VTSKYLHLDAYIVDPAHKMYQFSLRMAPGGMKHAGVSNVNKGVNIYSALIGFLHKIVSSVYGYGQDKVCLYSFVNLIVRLCRWSMPCPSCFTSGKVLVFVVWEAGWAPELGIHEESNSKLSYGNICCHSGQNQCRNINITLHTTKM